MKTLPQFVWVAAVAVAVAVVLTSYSGPAAAAPGDQFVIPPGQERLLAGMLGAKATDLPGGCKLESASILKTHVAIHYICAAGDVRFELHPSALAGGAQLAKTEKFVMRKGDPTVAPPDGLLDWVLDGVKTREKRFHWMTVRGDVPTFGGLNPSAPDAPDAEDLKEFDPALVTAFQEGQRQFRAQEHAAAVETFIALARKDPSFGGALGMIVANLAPTHPDQAAVDARVAAADAAPDDPLLSFVAGVAAHYSAHYMAETSEQKKALYATAIRMLDRSRPAFDFEPRTFIYLAVSHFRLGRQKQAEGLIETAVTLASHDPDAYYCRAEIFHRTEVERSLKDLDMYLTMVQRIRDAGGDVAESKMDRVREMQAFLRRVHDGKQEMTEVFDPLAGDTPSLEPTTAAEPPEEPVVEEPTEVAKALESPQAFGGWVIIGAGAVGLLLGLALLIRARRRRRET